MYYGKLLSPGSDVLWETPFTRELVNCEQIGSSGSTSNTYLKCD